MPTALRIRRRRLLVVGLGAALLVPLSVGPAGAQAPAATSGPTLSAAGGTVEGTLVRVIADPKRASATHQIEPSRTLSWIKPPHGVAVRVPTAQVAKLPVGAKVKVTIGGTVYDLAGLPPARQVLAASVVAGATTAGASPAPQFTAGPNEVTVVKVHPLGDSTSDTDDPTSVNSVIGEVNGAVASYWNDQTRGAVQLSAVPSSSGDTWVTSTAYSCSEADATNLFDDIAGKIGWTPGPGKHLLLYLSNDPSLQCDVGLGEVSAPGYAPGDGAYVTGQANAPELETSIITHELGHNFGLGHSSEELCDNSLAYGACGVAPYNDIYDVMGASWEQMGALNALQQQQLGVLPSGEVKDLQGLPGTRSVSLSTTGIIPAPGSTGLTRAILLGASDGLTYWLEYRSAAGQDAWLGDSRNTFKLDQGVVLHIEGDGPTGSAGDTSLLLDATPSTLFTDDQEAVKVGHSLWLSALDYYVTVKSATSSAANVQIQAGDAALSRDLDSNYETDLLTVDPSGVLYRYDSSGMGGFAGRVVMGRGWQARDLITMVGDWDGTGKAQDVVGRDSSGNLWLYTGAGRSAGFTGSRIIGRGWSGMSALFSPGDWNGDGNSDLIARKRADNSLWLYPGNGAGGFLTPTKIGNGWGSISSFDATGDFDLNGTADFIVRRTDGAMLLYRGDGAGGFDGTQVIGNGWNIFSSITGVGDWDADGAPDLLARKSDGTMWFYAGTGDGHFIAGRKVGTGWGPFRMAV